MTRTPHKQQGVTLIIALIMLVLITLLVITTVNLGQSSLQTVGNMQQQNETYMAAQTALETAISSTRFFDTPNDALANACNGVPNQYCVDTNGDNVIDVKVLLTPAPTCVKVRPLKNTSPDIDVANADDLGCSLGQPQNYGTEGANTGNSLCSDSTWELHAQASDAVTSAKVEVTQGVTVRVDNDAITTSCPGS